MAFSFGVKRCEMHAEVGRANLDYRRPHLFRAVLSYSRKGYSEVVWRQDTETFIRCCENAYRHFGGVTRTTVVDNLKAAVLDPDWFDPNLNPKMADFARYYGTVVLPTQPARPEHKGTIESGVKYAQNNALRGRSFSSLSEQNLFLAAWECRVADTRIHGTVRQQVSALFALERPALSSLPASLFPSFTEGRRKVHRDGHVEFDKADYSVPPEYLGREVWVRGQSRVIRVLNIGRKWSRSMLTPSQAGSRRRPHTSTRTRRAASNAAPGTRWNAAD